MTSTKESNKPKRSLAAKIGRVFLIVILSIVLLVLVVLLLIQTPPVQNFARKKINTFMTQKLNTKFEIGRIYIGFPKKVVLEDVYIEDLQKDTLLAGGAIKVNISMFKLLKSQVEINDLELEGITAKVKRQLPDTTFNFQFIVDAFAPKEPQPVPADTAGGMKINIKSVSLDKIRVVYDDVVSGSDMTLWLEHFDTDIDVFDLDQMNFSVPTINLRGIQARIIQTKPLAVPEAPEQDLAEASEPANLNLKVGDVGLKNINVDYSNDVSQVYTTVNLGELLVNARDINLKQNSIVLENLALNNTTAAFRLGKTEMSKTVVKEVEQEVQSESQNNWRVAVNSIRLNNNNIQFNNDNNPRQAAGMDFSHLNARDLTFHIDDFVFKADSIAGSVTRASMKEQSGFQLNQFETDFLYASNQAYLRNLLLETPGTVIRRTAELQYPSIESLQKNIGQLRLNIDLNDTRIQVKDILTFVPDLRSQPAFSNPSTVWYINGEVKGSVAALDINQLQIQALRDTRIDIRGQINGLPDAQNVSGALDINTFRTSRADIQALTGGALPTNITIPEIINMKGSVAGSMDNARANLNIQTNLGSADINGSLRNGSKPNTAEYNATLNTRNLDLGAIMQNDTMFGPITANIVASGRGFDMKTGTANLRGVIESAVLNRYTYHDVQLNGTLARQVASATISIDDPNIDLELTGRADLSKEFPSVELDAQIDSIKTMPLNFTPNALFYSGTITGDFPVTDPKNLQGDLLISNSLLVVDNKRLPIDSIELSAGKTDTGQYIRLNSDFASFALTGQYNLPQMGTIFQNAIQPYFELAPAGQAPTPDPYDFRFNLQVTNAPVIQAFMPTLERLEPLTMQGRFSSTDGWNTTASTPLVILASNRIENLNLNAGTGQDAITMTMNIDQMSAGTMNLYGADLTARIANNNIAFRLGVDDANGKNKYILGGNFNQPETGVYALSLSPDTLMLNYDKWTIAENNLVRLDNGDINISNFLLSRENQQLQINSTEPGANSPLEVRFTDFQIQTITAFLKQDTVLADGSINGQVVLNDIATQLTFTSDLNITNLAMRGDTLGNLALKVNSPQKNLFNADIRLTGNGNDLAVTGNYQVRPNSPGVFDMNLDLKKLELATLEGASSGALSNASGYLNGEFKITGSMDQPVVNGSLGFNQAAFNLTMLNSFYQIDQERIVVNPEGIRFNTFTIKDSANNSLVLNGNAYTKNFTNYEFDLKLTADNFRAVNSTARNSQVFYGQLYFDTDLNIHGTETNPVIDGSIGINENTAFTIVLPQQDPAVVSREGIVRFVDMDSLRVEDTLSLASYDSLNNSALTGMEVSVNITIDREATFSLIIDEGNGDFVRVKGEAALTGGIDKSGKVNLTGSYEIEEGAYELTFNFLQRRFEIQKGSTITWLGEPTRADLDVTAVYIANTAPLTLVEDQLGGASTMVLNTYKQKLPFEVLLQLQGEMMKPDITFDVVLPEDQNYGIATDITNNVRVRLEQLRAEPSELNKQVFALLLLNRFVSENPFASGGDGLNAGTVARQSVSKILTEQLNNLAGDLIQGVDLNFDVVSAEDYSTGQMQNRTDLNVSLSKQLLNDRLKVTVGSNFELEGPSEGNQRGNNLAGNVALDYMLSKDGRYMLRAYRRNQYQGVIEGYILETGVNFIITLDYNHFHNLFRRKKKPEPQPKKPDENTDNTKANSGVADSLNTESNGY